MKLMKIFAIPIEDAGFFEFSLFAFVTIQENWAHKMMRKESISQIWPLTIKKIPKATSNITNHLFIVFTSRKINTQAENIMIPIIL